LVVYVGLLLSAFTLVLVAGCKSGEEGTTPAEPGGMKKAVSQAEPPAKTTAKENATEEGAPELKVGTTLENLQAAFDGESNAHKRYLAFAAKAEEEGYKQAALLFTAAARAEEIHAKSHAKVIEKLGGTPTADIKEPEVKTTKENLEAALKGETYEKNTMYPEFLKVAKADKNADAIRTLNGAMTVEEEHAALYQAALDDLEGQKAITSPLWVCPVCGHTVQAQKLDFSNCPICNTPADQFEKIDQVAAAK